LGHNNFSLIEFLLPSKKLLELSEHLIVAGVWFRAFDRRMDDDPRLVGCASAPNETDFMICIWFWFPADLERGMNLILKVAPGRAASLWGITRIWMMD
jgi:hypothetical protein